jgi:hypothetical protein
VGWNEGAQGIGGSVIFSRISVAWVSFVVSRDYVISMKKAACRIREKGNAVFMRSLNFFRGERCGDRYSSTELPSLRP